MKAFDAQLLKSLTLSRKGFDLDFEIFVKLFHTIRIKKTFKFLIIKIIEKANDMIIDRNIL